MLVVDMSGGLAARLSECIDESAATRLSAADTMGPQEEAAQKIK